MDGVETNTGIYVGPNDTGTHPLLADSDGDGFTDGQEVQLGSDPNNPVSTPLTLLPGLSPLGAFLCGLALISAYWLVLRRRSNSVGTT